MPQFLILDEATSALDTESEKSIRSALGAVVKGRTTFVIAHRLSTVEMADRIFMLEQGRIAEEGTHQDLLSARERTQSSIRLTIGSPNKTGTSLLLPKKI